METIPFEVAAGFGAPAVAKAAGMLGPVGRVAGGLIDPLTRGLEAIPQAATKFGRVARSTGIGAGLGALFGAGQDIAETGQPGPSVGPAALLGGAVGGGGQSLYEGSAPLIQNLYNRFYQSAKPWTFSERQPMAREDFSRTPYPDEAMTRQPGPMVPSSGGGATVVDNAQDVGPEVLRAHAQYTGTPEVGNDVGTAIQNFENDTYDIFAKMGQGTLTEEEMSAYMAQYNAVSEAGYGDLANEILEKVRRGVGGSQPGEPGKPPGLSNPSTTQPY